jgi:UDP-N-acetylmuramoyl-tripeptide--D-alanyl-D-alanine ligase
MSLAIAAEALKAPLSGEDRHFTGVSSDTRRLQRGDLFIALKGPNYDGVSFLAEAIAVGAVGAVVSRKVVTPLPYIKVDDARLAFGRLANFWRQQFTIPVIGITGSNGKTTVKEMIAAILAESGPGCVTIGNLNNDVGVPLTLCRLRAEHRYAVIEMGMNHRGEIDYLTRLSLPTIALITNAAEAHLEGVGTVQDVAHAKGEIFAGLGKGGIAVINADDAYADLWRKLASNKKVLSFGLREKADVTAEVTPAESGSVILLHTPEGEIESQLSLLGRHSVMNALAATAASQVAGASLEAIAAGLQKVKPMAGRLELKQGIAGARIIDDSYNANPSSLAAGLQVLKEFGGERVLVLGDMAELGSAARDIHRRVGEMAKKTGIARVYTLGELSADVDTEFGKGAKHFTDHQALIETLHDCLHSEMTVLVKGSRKMHMEQVVAGITAAEHGGRRNQAVDLNQEDH